MNDETLKLAIQCIDGQMEISKEFAKNEDSEKEKEWHHGMECGLAMALRFIKLAKKFETK